MEQVLLIFLTMLATQNFTSIMHLFIKKYQGLLRQVFYKVDFNVIIKPERF